jgi:hypothetical protein
MLIQVKYPDNRFDYVKDDVLHSLIKSNGIMTFRRSSGWVTIGVDPLRQFNRGSSAIQSDGFKSIVQVELSDNRYDYVSDKMLDTLIESNKIVKFKRITGWVTVGVDPLRAANRGYTYRNPSELKRRTL